MRPRVLVLNFHNGVVGRQRAPDRRAAGRRASPRARATTATPTPRAPAVPALPDREGRRPDRPAGARRAGPTRRARCCRRRRPASSIRWRCSRRSSPPSTASPIRARRRAGRCRCASCSSRGVVNEVWIQDGEAGVRRAPLNLERKQVYDGTETRRPRQLRALRGRRRRLPRRHHLRRHRPHRAPRPRARARLRSRGARLGDRGDVGALPACAPTRCAFLNRDFDTRFGVHFDGWDHICDQAGHALRRLPDADQRASGTYADGTRLDDRPFPARAAAARPFPPNATARWDIANHHPGRFALRALRPRRRRGRRRHLRALHAPPRSPRPTDVPRLRRRLADLLAPEHPGPQQPRQDAPTARR